MENIDQEIGNSVIEKEITIKSDILIEAIENVPDIKKSEMCTNVLDPVNDGLDELYENTETEVLIEQKLQEAVNLEVKNIEHNVQDNKSNGYETDLDCIENEQEDDCKIEPAANYRQLILMNMLSCIGAEEYLPVLEQHNISHETLRLLDDDDLEVMGITEKKHVLDLLNYIRALPHLQRRSYYETFDEPLLNKDIILNLSKHIDLLTLALGTGLRVSCHINDINCRKPLYNKIENEIIYPEGIKSSEVVIETSKYLDKKIDDLFAELENSKRLWGIDVIKPKKKGTYKNIFSYLCIITITFTSCIFFKKMLKS